MYAYNSTKINFPLIFFLVFFLGFSDRVKLILLNNTENEFHSFLVLQFINSPINRH